MREKAEEIFEKHWKKATDLPLDDLIKNKMSYCIDAMLEFSEQKESVIINDNNCTCHTSYCSIMNGTYICHTCNRPLKGFINQPS